MTTTKRLPAYAYISTEDIPKYEELTKRGTYSLIEEEVFWRDRYQDLEKHGYELRPRYRPDWTPSWSGTNLKPLYCEDAVAIARPHVIDATRKEDRMLVSLKCAKKGSQEIEIARFLSSIKTAHNHCISLLDVVPDPLDPDMCFLVTPYLRPMNNPPFGTAGEVVDFIQQTLEGLVFLHEHRIAHRDIAAPNIMMDGRPLYPQGHHPVQLNYSPDNVYELTPLARIDHPVRYFFIDFGISHRFEDGTPTMLVGRRGRNQDVPELSATVPYDALKVDVYALGDLYHKEFTQTFDGLGFLSPVIDGMRQCDPAQRMSAKAALEKLREVESRLNTTSRRWRLRARTESTPERMVYDTIYLMKRLMG